MKEQSSPPPARSRRVLWGILVPVLLVGGWFGVTAAVRRHVDEVVQAAVGVPLPDFRLPRLGADGAPAGGEVAAVGLRGQRVVLHFFRSFCSSCDAEAPAIRELEQALDPRETAVVHVMTDQLMGFDPAATTATLRRKGFTAPVVMADAALMAGFHQVTWSRVTPVTYLVDRTGVIRTALRGRQTVDSIRGALASLP